jgi:hypothetical protein
MRPTSSGDDSTEPTFTRQYSWPVRAFHAMTKPRAPDLCFRHGRECMYAWYTIPLWIVGEAAAHRRKLFLQTTFPVRAFTA